MMTPDHTSVQLPARMETADLLALVQQLGARMSAVRGGAKMSVPVGCPVGVHVPAPVDASFKRLTQRASELREITVSREAMAHAATDEDPRASANEASDNAWRAMHSWLYGWTMLTTDDASPSPTDAAELYARVFPDADGMRFINWRPRKQWNAMEQRMTTLADPAAVATLTALGGKRVLAQLRSTHTAFGRAFGFTRALAEAVTAVDTRPQIVAASGRAA